MAEEIERIFVIPLKKIGFKYAPLPSDGFIAGEAVLWKKVNTGRKDISPRQSKLNLGTVLEGTGLSTKTGENRTVLSAIASAA